MNKSPCIVSLDTNRYLKVRTVPPIVKFLIKEVKGAHTLWFEERRIVGSGHLEEVPES